MRTATKAAIGVAIAVAVVIGVVVLVRALIPPMMVRTCADTGEADTSFCTSRPVGP